METSRKISVVKMSGIILTNIERTYHGFCLLRYAPMGYELYVKYPNGNLHKARVKFAECGRYGRISYILEVAKAEPIKVEEGSLLVGCWVSNDPMETIETYRIKGENRSFDKIKLPTFDAYTHLTTKYPELKFTVRGCGAFDYDTDLSCELWHIRQNEIYKVKTNFNVIIDENGIVDITIPDYDEKRCFATKEEALANLKVDVIGFDDEVEETNEDNVQVCVTLTKSELETIKKIYPKIKIKIS